MPVVGGRKRSDDEVDLARSRGRPRGRDGGLDLLLLLDERFLDHRALRAVLLRRNEARLRCRRDRAVEPRRGRRWRRPFLRRGRWRGRRLRRGLTRADARREVDDFLVSFLLVFVLLL